MPDRPGPPGTLAARWLLRWARAPAGRRALTTLFAAEIAVVVALSLISASALPALGLAWGDKLGHFLAYAVTTGTGLLALSRRWAVIAGMIALGLALEVVQGVGTAGRSAEALDALANVLGVATAALGARALERVRQNAGG